jgi:hypothetical protein
VADPAVLDEWNRCALCSLHSESVDFPLLGEVEDSGLQQIRDIPIPEMQILWTFFEYLVFQIRERLGQPVRKCECFACEQKGKNDATAEVLDICQSTPKWIAVCATCEPVIRILIPDPERWRAVPETVN